MVWKNSTDRHTQELNEVRAAIRSAFYKLENLKMSMKMDAANTTDTADKTKTVSIVCSKLQELVEIMETV